MGFQKLETISIDLMYVDKRRFPSKVTPKLSHFLCVHQVIQ